VLEGLDTGRLRSLGWRPDIGLEEGMARTLAWIEGGPGRE
jgi:nucleoside-diphosphate-sugar epimerase